MTDAPPHSAAAGTGAADPSMEDILASIRRILNEDEVAQTAQPAPHDTQPVEPNAGGSGGGDEDGVLVLDEGMLVTPVPAEPPAAPIPEMALAPASVALPVPVPVQAASNLMAPESVDAAASSVGSLLRTLSSERASQVHRGGPTIEDLVREELRPLLKEWLDQHLPPLVERAVRREIERVTGRAMP